MKTFMEKKETVELVKKINKELRKVKRSRVEEIYRRKNKGWKSEVM